MMKNRILTDEQMEIMQEFYSFPATRIEFDKRERGRWWNIAKIKSKEFDFELFKEKCPALEHQVRRSYESGRNIQSAVFSECVYAQTIANMMHLSEFVNCMEEDANAITEKLSSIIHEKGITPRYIYLSPDGDRMLIQAGGCGGPDGIVINMNKRMAYTIEFKEPGAKSSEHDLPQYKDDGVMIITEEWNRRYPQYDIMLEEAEGLNFFEIMGSNYNDFSETSVEYAIANNYSSGGIDVEVVCTEDINGELVMIPSNHMAKWASNIEGEIRPAGRNHSKVWTEYALRQFLLNKEATINGNIVTILKTKLTEAKQRGGTQISRYKINPLFFIPVDKCEEREGTVCFNINDVEQLRPTIAGKMFFGNIQFDVIKEYYNL